MEDVQFSAISHMVMFSPCASVVVAFLLSSKIISTSYGQIRTKLVDGLGRSLGQMIRV